MTARFVATTAATTTQDDVVLTGVAAEEPSTYLTFQRSRPVGAAEDWGVHIEFRDQRNSGYDRVRHCSLEHDLLRVELTAPVDWENKYTCVEVELRVSAREWDDLAQGLRQVFAGREHLLSVQRGQPS